MYALILAGGRGERLRPLTDTIPKPMVKVKGRPIIWYQIAWLKDQGITDVMILCGYKWTTIRDYVGNGKDFGVKAHYSVEETPLGRGGAIKQGLSALPESEQTIVVLNGDVLTSQELGPLLRLHHDSNSPYTMMLIPYPSAYGVVEMDGGGRVTAFNEKGSLPHWIHAGVDILDRGIARELPDVGDHETTTLPRLAQQRQLYAFLSQAHWQSIDSFKDLREAEEAQAERAPADAPSG